MNTDTIRKIRLPLCGSGADAIARAPLSGDGDIVNWRVIALVSPTEEHALSQIPKGPNPRYLDATNRLSREIREAYATDPVFGVKSGGVHVIYDDESLNVEEEDGKSYIEFTCSEEYTGHYDGQHTMNAVDQAVADTKRPVEHEQHLMVSLVPRSVFDSLSDIRGVAKAVNCRSQQKAMSELDIAGVFEDLKNNISYCQTQDILWAQNQKDTSGNKIRSERSATQVVAMLAAFAPLTHTKSVADIARFPKNGEQVLKALRHEDWSGVFEAAIPHVDAVLAMADYIRENTQTVLDGDFDTCALVRMTTKAELGKTTVSERKAFKCELFDGGRSVEYGLHKDLLPMLCYAMIKASYNRYDRSKNAFSPRLTMEEMKALWLTCGKDVLGVINDRFKYSFAGTYKSRWSDFVLDITMWTEVESVVIEAYYNKSWKGLLNIKLDPAA